MTLVSEGSQISYEVDSCADMFVSLAAASLLRRTRWKFPLLGEEGGGGGGCSIHWHILTLTQAAADICSGIPAHPAHVSVGRGWDRQAVQAADFIM